MTERCAPEPAPVAPASACILTGTAGENADDCTTHEHEAPAGVTVSPSSIGREVTGFAAEVAKTRADYELTDPLPEAVLTEAERVRRLRMWVLECMVIAAREPDTPEDLSWAQLVSRTQQYVASARPRLTRAQIEEIGHLTVAQLLTGQTTRRNK